MEIPKELKYTKQHEWVRIRGGKALVGITHYAQEQLGDITYIELPSSGKPVKQSEPLCAVESVKAASDIYAPLSGSVSAVNSALEANPEKVNQSPYDEGWIAEMVMDHPSEADKLMDSAAYEQYLKEAAN